MAGLPDPWIGLLVASVFSFLSLAFLFVNIGLVIGTLFFLVAYSWGGQRSDLGHLLANEKIIAELVGVVVAVVAVALLFWFEKRRKSANGTA